MMAAMGAIDTTGKTTLILVMALLGLAGLLLFLAQDWIVNWDPKAYQNLQGEPFREPVRLKHQPWYGWCLGLLWGMPIVLGLIQGLRGLWHE
jgi:hypothetical protein